MSGYGVNEKVDFRINSVLWGKKNYVEKSLDNGNGHIGCPILWSGRGGRQA